MPYPERSWRSRRSRRTHRVPTQADQALRVAFAIPAATKFPGYAASSPTRLRAKSSASKGRRSSAFSPTPMKCTGMPYFSASATSTPPLRGAVELGHDDAGDADHVAEGLGLGVRVLADRGVEHQQHRMRRRWHRPSSARARSSAARPSDAALLWSRPAVSISSTSAPSLPRRLEGVEGEARRVGAGRARHHRRRRARPRS